MTKQQRLGLYVLGGLSLAAGVTITGGISMVYRALPRVNGCQRLPGLTNSVEVIRDRWGVPHIFGSTNRDIFLALGYVHAQDRLWQMELNRRVAHGHLAAIFGVAALSSDRFVRVMGLSRVAEREVNLLDDDTRAIVEAYVAGINAFLQVSINRLPIEFALLGYRPSRWNVVDVLVFGKLLALNLCGNWTSELLNAHLVKMLGEKRTSEIAPSYAASHPLVIPPDVKYRFDARSTMPGAESDFGTLGPGASAMQGSNAWVAAGWRTVRGSPLLASDPHMTLTLPSVWYEAHLQGGEYHVSGVTMPGAPGVVIGHNARIAWGITNAPVDVQDLYLERFHPTDPSLYEWCGEWRHAHIVREEIMVKGRQEPVVEHVRVTRHGPVITPVASPGGPLRPEQPLALRWTALEPSARINRAILALNRADNWDEFRTALADWTTPPQNFVYADVEGHFGYRLAGDIPIRAQGDGRLPVPGWSGTHVFLIS